MVDSIKTVSTPDGSRPNSNSLRTNFKSLSSGTVANKPAPPPEESEDNSNESPESTRANQVLSDLNEAVSYSAKAVKLLERLSENGSSSSPSNAVEPSIFSDDVFRLRENIDRVKSRAEVVAENVKSSEVQLQDVNVAQEQASKTGAAINLSGEQAIEAHSKLSPANVAKVLLG